MRFHEMSKAEIYFVAGAYPVTFLRIARAV